MSTRIHLTQLETQSLSLDGTISVEELDFGINDDLIQTSQPLEYALTAQLLEKDILIEGRLKLPLDCCCARCLTPFVHTVNIDPWACLLPVTGEDAIEMSGDSIDLTPIIRDDVLLEFPRHPLCRADCEGLRYEAENPFKNPRENAGISVWEALNNLKLEQ